MNSGASRLRLSRAPQRGARRPDRGIDAGHPFVGGARQHDLFEHLDLARMIRVAAHRWSL